MSESPKLEYLISMKGDYLVVSLSGWITKSTAQEIEKCQAEISKNNVKFVVLNFKGVDRIDIGGVPALIRMQKSVRDLKRELRICCISPDVEKSLLETGAGRVNEMAID